MEKLSSMKPVPGAQKAGDCWCKRPYPGQPSKAPIPEAVWSPFPKASAPSHLRTIYTAFSLYQGCYSPHLVLPHLTGHPLNAAFPHQIILKSNLLHGPSIRPSLPLIKVIFSKISPGSLSQLEWKQIFFFSWMYTALAWITIPTFSNYLGNRMTWILDLLLISHTVVSILR